MEKIEIARRELGTALQLFLDNKCTVSIHVLASAGADIVERLVDHTGGEPFRDRMLTAMPDVTKKMVNDAMHRFANAFKHLNEKDGRLRDDEELLSQFDDQENASILFKGWLDYGTMTGRLPFQAQAFQAWFLARHGGAEEWHGPLKQVSSLSYKSSKQILLQFISDLADNVEVLGDPMTETGPLMMPPL